MAESSATATVGEIIVVQRPRRADAARNFDALLAAAREAFAENGADASLEDIARRAGVGIGTLYRNFPTRRHLFESVYAEEVNALGKVAADLAGDPPWQALTTWLRRFVDYTITKKAVRDALNGESDIFLACRDSLYESGGPLLRRAQQAGEARADMSFDDLLRMVSGITSAAFLDADQRDRVLDIALDGVRVRR
ncbi:TetR/AcrR family transcriptional regulator [Streptacidiphilus carbonis]|jgi:AcrR family transcriptional regulator|uniref:TetR/AcrR family transcriptional regulator n=1 Tax=Streptacidiphilus carbonis TaxID=105422 RepID=UPI0005AA7AA3|nr:TetR/AcrR family transcriptional regulator [Streptacidiphilus carbonis]